MTLPKAKIKSLKGRERISNVFEQGQFLKNGPLAVRYAIDDTTNTVFIGVSVSKKGFPKAVDRNRIKRKMRAGLSAVLNEVTIKTGSYMFLFIGTKTQDIADLPSVFKKLLDGVS
jgi:ribonuclease P protein component